MKRTITGLCLLPLLAAGCATAPGMGRSDSRATLNGLQEVPGPGDPNGSGTATVRADPGAPEVCWELFARDIDTVTVAHIHRGAEGAAGAPVVTLTAPGADGRSEGCAAVDEAVAREIANRPYDFYVNVHTAAFPTGAIRGQLRGAVRQLRRGEE